MPLKCIYRWLGPLYYDFMGFDMGFLFSVFILSYSFFAQKDQRRGSFKMLCVCGQIFSVYMLILAHTFNWACVLVFPCIGHGSSTTVQLGLFSGCSITTISVSTLRAYTYQSECRADGPHSSGPSDVLLRLCSRFKLQYGHMSLTCTALMWVCRRAA